MAVFPAHFVCTTIKEGAVGPGRWNEILGCYDLFLEIIGELERYSLGGYSNGGLLSRELIRGNCPSSHSISRAIYQGRRKQFKTGWANTT